MTLAVINHAPVSYSWRIAFLAGPALGFLIIFVRRNLPESPRWLLMQGRVEEAEAAVAEIERNAIQSGGSCDDVDESKAIEVRPAPQIGFVALARTLFATYPRRSILGASLMITQSFLYNAIFFTYSLVLTKIYGVPKGSTPYYFMFFAAGNLLGPLTIGRLFDTIGRRKMITGTYILSGILLAISAFLFNAGLLDAVTQTVCWCVIFFFASAGASAAYLTVSEIFPVEVRAKAIAVFFAIAQSFGAFGPWFYGKLIGDGSDHFKLFIGYMIGAGVMVAGGLVEAFLGIDAEGRSLEDLALPLGAVDQPRPSALANVTGAPRDHQRLAPWPAVGPWMKCRRSPKTGGYAACEALLRVGTLGSRLGKLPARGRGQVRSPTGLMRRAKPCPGRTRLSTAAPSSLSRPAILRGPIERTGAWPGTSEPVCGRQVIHTVPEDPSASRATSCSPRPPCAFMSIFRAVNGASRPTARDVGYERGRSRVV